MTKGTLLFLLALVAMLGIFMYIIGVGHPTAEKKAARAAAEKTQQERVRASYAAVGAEEVMSEFFDDGSTTTYRSTVYDDGSTTAYLSVVCTPRGGEGIHGCVAEIMRMKASWQARFPEKRVTAMTAIPGYDYASSGGGGPNGLLIHYELR